MTIFATNQVPQGAPDTAIFFPATEDKKPYHYYLIPRDSTSDIIVEKVSLEKLTKDQIAEDIRSHLTFTQCFPCNTDNGHSGNNFHGNGHYGNNSVAGASACTTIPTVKHFQLSSDVEKG